MYCRIELIVVLGSKDKCFILSSVKFSSLYFLAFEKRRETNMEKEVEMGKYVTYYPNSEPLFNPNGSGGGGDLPQVFYY